MTFPHADIPLILASLREAQAVHLKAQWALILVNRRRPLEKLSAISRLMARTDLPPDGKAWTWTRAEDLARVDTEYDAFKQQVETLEQKAKEAEYAAETMRLEALLVASA